MIRQWSVRASTALFGLSLAIAIAPYLQFRARPGDPLSALKLEGYRPSGLTLQFVAVVLLTALFAILGERIARLLADYQWAAGCYSLALLAAPLTLMYYGNWRHLLLVGATAVAIVALRRRDPHFTLLDAILVPAFLSCCIAFLDTNFGHTPVATALRAAIAIFAVRLLVRSADAFAFTPLALLAQAGWLMPAVSGAIAMVVLLLVPVIVDRVQRRGESGERRAEKGEESAARSSALPSPLDPLPSRLSPLRRNLIYPLIVALYPLAVLHGSAPYTMSIFEDSHAVPVATEMMRGERPYTDIVPTHGLIADGVIDLVGLEIGGGSLRKVLLTRLLVGVTSSAAVYFLTFAATGSAELALLGTFLAFSLTSAVAIWTRPPAALFALAATVAATRLRSRRWFIVAGALVALAWLFSVDFALYSAIVALFAAFRSRALGALAIGIAAAAAPLLLLFAILGFALDFLRVTFFELPTTHSVYFIHPLLVPDVLRSPAILHHLTSEDAIYPFIWLIALIASCVAFARSPLRARRGDAPWLIGVWMVVAAASWVERGNNYFFLPLVPFAVASLYKLWRRSRPIAVALTISLVLLAQPFRHVITVVPGYHTAPAPPLFDETSDHSIQAARRFAKTLKPGETFVDFSNTAILYSLLGRDCPLRYVEVANYQSEAMQREVIDRIARNPHVRAALIACRGTNSDVDGIPNRERAPLVWSYLQHNFTPAFDEDGVVFWRRK